MHEFNENIGIEEGIDIKLENCRVYRDTKQEGIENAICHFLAILHSCSQNRQTVPTNHAV